MPRVSVDAELATAAPKESAFHHYQETTDMGQELALPEGRYPIIDRRMPLTEIVQVTASQELRALIFAHCSVSGLTLKRDVPTTIACVIGRDKQGSLVVIWPTGSAELQVLAPKSYVTGLH